METLHTRKIIRRRIPVVFLLILSLLASPAFAVPLPTLAGSLKSMDSAPRVIPDLSPQVELSGLKRHEGGGRRRKLRVVTDDYGGTGANNKHDPSTGSR